jgi:molybdenum cofactor synthesis domain-containing protein
VTDRVPWDEARVRAHRTAVPPAPRLVVLAAAGGAVLADPLTAPVALPPADSSAMDGYAVRGAPPWRVVGALRAAEVAGSPLELGQACAVVTGAPLPKATDAVLPVEDALRTGDELRGRAVPGRHIRRAGEECAAGDRLADAGLLVTPAVLGLAAALGHDALRVHPVPAVRALVTGDELATEGPPAPGRVRDAIGPMLPGLVAAAGGRWAGSTRVPDDPELLAAALAAPGADLLLVSGASGPGPADHLRPVLAAVGAELLVGGVACRPGHPQTLARLPGGTPVVGLPGNPFAALVAFLTLAVPALAGLRGRALPELARAPARDLDPHPSDHRIVPVRLRGGVAGPVGHGGAAMLRGAAVADRLAVLAPGESTTVRLFPDLGGPPWVA